MKQRVKIITFTKGNILELGIIDRSFASDKSIDGIDEILTEVGKYLDKEGTQKSVPVKIKLP